MKLPVLTLALMTAACGQSPSNETKPSSGLVAASVAAPAPNGRWLVTHVNGDEVREGEFFLRTENGRLSGGYDGCNSWSFVLDSPGVIEGTLQGCGKSARMQAYDNVALSEKAVLEMDGDALVLRHAENSLRAVPIVGEAQIPMLIADNPPLVR